MSSVAAPYGACTGLADLDAITDEERLRTMWQQAEDFGERRRIRARMYKLKEQRLREMMQNDEESLGSLMVAEDGGVSGGDEESSPAPVRRASNIQVTMHVDGDKAVTESISTQNVRLGGLTLRGVEGIEGFTADQVIEERMRKASEERPGRFQRIIGELSDGEGDAVVSITKNTYSIQSNALAGEGYLSLKNKEVRDSVSPTRVLRERRSSAEDETSATEGRLTSDDEAALKTESENVIQELNKSTSRTTTTTTSSSRKTSREERSNTTTRTPRSRQSEIPVRRESPRKVSERKTSKELDLNSTSRRGGGGVGEKSSPTSPTRRVPGESSPRSHASRRTGAQKEAPTSPNKSPTRTGTRAAAPSSKKSHLAEIESKMEKSIMSELDKLDTYLSGSVDDQDEVIMEQEEDVVDEAGNVVRMLVQTRRKKDGTECTARRVARSTKVVDTEGEIDEILIGNPDHEVLQRDVSEEEDKDGNKIKIITETRKRPDGITYTTKNVLKTSKIFDYDHPEDVAYSEDDELVSTNETEETDENGITIKTVTETRRKNSGVEYTTKKVYKTAKVRTTRITPSDDDEVLDTHETEEKAADGSTVRTVVETRRTKTGEEYTHRQVFRSRRMTLSAVDLQHGLPTMDNDDEVVNRAEKEETDEAGRAVRVVTETRRRKDGSTYSFEYVLRSFQGTEDEVKKMPVGGPGASNIAVSADDELLKEDVKEEVLEDGTTVKTIIERRRTKDGTEYLRHRILRVPKMPEPVLQVANLEDEVLQEEVSEETLKDGTHCRAVTERRRSSVSGMQYTLRRVSRVYQQPALHPRNTAHEILDENVTEEETDDGTVVKTVIQRYQRPDGSVYTTHHVHKTFSCPAPVTLTGMDQDELLDRRVDEEETDDGYITKTVVETRRRADGVQYTVERTERTAKHGQQVHISFSSARAPRPEDVVTIGSPDDTVISSEEREEEDEDGSVVRTVLEVRRRLDGTEYTTKTVLRSAPVLVPERETSFVVIKPEGGDDEEAGLFPSPDDEVVYTRRREEPGEDGRPVTVVIETRQSKATGERYNVTKRVHTTDVLLTDQGEHELPRGLMKTTLVANVSAPAPAKTTLKATPATPKATPATPRASPATPRATPVTPRATPATPRATPATPRATPATPRTTTASPKTASPSSPASRSPERRQPDTESQPEEPDNIPYGSVSALKSRFSPAGVQRPESPDKPASNRPERVNTLDKKRFFEDAAKVAGGSPTPSRRPQPKHLQDEPAEDLDKEIALLEEKEKERYQQEEAPRPEPREPEEDEEEEEEEEEEEVEREEEEDEEEVTTSPSEEEPHEAPTRRPDSPRKAPTAKVGDRPRRTVEDQPRKRREVSSKKSEEPARRAPASGRRAPTQEDSPPRRVPGHKEPVSRRPTKTSPTSPQRVSSSPRRGRSPDQPGDSAQRDVTPTSRPLYKRHNETEPVSPTRTQQRTAPRTAAPTTRKTTSPEGKPKLNGDVRKPEDRTPRGRRPVERPGEPERSSVRPSRLSQTPRKTPTARSPDKREPTRPTTGRPSDRKSPTKPSEKTPKGRHIEPKATLSVPEPKDPVVTLPETPMTEDMKPLPSEEPQGPKIEDVSTEPDLPYHTVHRPSIVREPSEYNIQESPEEPSDSSPEEPSDTEPRDGKPQKKAPRKTPDSPVKETVSRPRKTKPLESRLSDKSLSPKDKKQPESKRPARDRPWLVEKRNSFEKKPSEPKVAPGRTPDKRKVVERKPSEELLEKPKAEKPKEDQPEQEQPTPSDSDALESPVPASPSPSPMEEEPEDSRKIRRKAEEMSSRVIRDVERSVASQIITDKTITTTGVAAKRSLFNRVAAQPDTLQPDTKKDRPGRKPSYEMKDSVFSRRSMFEQPKQQEPAPSPVRRPVLKTTFRKDDTTPKMTTSEPEKRQPVKEPLIVPKHVYKLGEEEEPAVEGEVSMTSSKLVMNAMASTRPRPDDSPERTPAQPPRRERSPVEPLRKERTPTEPVRRERSPDEPSRRDRSPAEPLRKERTPTEPLRKERTPTEPLRKERTPTEPLRKERTPTEPLRKERTPTEPLRKERTPTEPLRKERTPAEPVRRERSPDEPVRRERSPAEPLRKERSPAEPLRKERTPAEPVRRERSPAEPLRKERTPAEPVRRERSPDEPVRRERSPAEPVRRERSPAEPLGRERSTSPLTKAAPRSKEGSPAPRGSKEPSPVPFSKETSPSRFVTGRPVDSGFDLNKVRRIERAASNKKLLEDLEVPSEDLPQYLSSVHTIFDITILESMLEKAVSYEERRLIRGQLRLAKRPGSSPSQPRQPAQPTKKPAEPQPSEPARKPSEPSRKISELSRKISEPKQPSEPSRKVSEPREPSEPSRKVSEPRQPSEPSRKVSEPRQPTESRSLRPGTIPETDGSSHQPLSKTPDHDEPSRASPTRVTRDHEKPREPEEPRTLGRTAKPDEPKKFQPVSRSPEPSRVTRTPQPVQPAAPSNEPYVEPLRYQKGQSKTPSKPAAEQSDVDKIVSAYGVGPTDEFGVPLFGLRALKRRTPPSTDTGTPGQSQPSTEETRPSTAPQEEPKEEEYVPKDSSGRPLFGLRSLRRTTPETSTVTTTETARHTASTSTTVLQRGETAVVESSRLVASISKRPTHTTEGATTEHPDEPESEEEEDQEEEEEEEEEQQQPQHSSDEEEETSPRLVKSVRDSIRKRDDEPEVRPQGKSRLIARPSQDDVTSRRSQPLREVTKLHETRAQEPDAVEDSPRHKTRDLESDCTTRSLNTKNVTAHHETTSTTTTSSSSFSSDSKVKSEKKLTGILKKTSTSSLLGDDKAARDQLNSTDDILDTLTEDQISRLSQEFDLRAQEDGVIKTEEAVEELEGGYRVTSRTTGEHPDGYKFTRKTSYTEIKLQQPSIDDGSSRQVTSSSSATVESSSTATFHSTSGGQHEDGEMREGRSFLEDRSKVTGISDVLSRMGATEAVDHEAKVTSDDQARSLLNRFLGAQVLMSGVESMMASSSLSESSRVEADGEGVTTVTKAASGHSSSTATKDGEVTHHQSSSFSTPVTTTTTTTTIVKGEPVVVSGVNITEVWDEDKLNQLLDTCGEYDDRRRIRMRLKAIMADKKGDKTSAVSPFGSSTHTSTTEIRTGPGSSQKTFSSSYSSSSTSSSSRASHFSKTGNKTVSPFDKFKKLDAQQSPRPTKE